MQNQKILEKKINIKFKNKRLLFLSLIHKSSDPLSNNEKLEFLGDRVLALVISEKLFNLYPDESEGNLDKKFASLVNRKTCLKISKILDLGKFLILGNTYKKNLKIEDRILSDACEALIGAIYTDRGYNYVKEFVLRFWKKNINESHVTILDPKTKLQEYSLKHYKKLPFYRLLNSKGPKHNPIFKISVTVNKTKQFTGLGKSKKQAEQDAAAKLLKSIN